MTTDFPQPAGSADDADLAGSTEHPSHDYISTIYDTGRTPVTEYPRQLVAHLMERFSLVPGTKLVELGCGRGDFLTAFQKAGFDCTGIDRVEASVRLSPHLEIRTCDLSKDRLPFDDNSIDVIYHKSLIEHLYDAETLMAESVRVLKPGGKLVVLTPDWQSQWKNFYEDYTHSRPYDELSLSDLLRVTGLRNVSAEKFLQLPIAWRSGPARFLARMLRLLLNVYQARWLTSKSGIRFFRWSVELMILGYGEK